MAQPVSTAIDSLTAALRSNIIPNQEYLLQGSILDSSVEVLLHRLRGLCDNVDAALETFHDHEMCFSISRALIPFLTLKDLSHSQFFFCNRRASKQYPSFSFEGEEVHRSTHDAYATEIRWTTRAGYKINFPIRFIN